MWSRRDQIHAYQFVRRRTVSAVLLGDADHARSPTRRAVVGAAMGALALVLLLGGFCVYGFLRPGSSTAWRTPGAIVQEKETGARFVLGGDGALHPVLNFASARLVTGGSGTLTRVSAKSLAAVPRGAAVGIEGAPDTLPAARRLVDAPWLACSARPGDAGPGDQPRTTVLLGRQPGTGRIALGPGAALVVRAGKQAYVVTDGRRFRVRSSDPDAVLGVLGLGQAPRVVVDPRWLSTIPAGPDLGYLDVRRLGATSDLLGPLDARVGQVFVQQVAGSSGGQYFLLLPDGLAPLSTTQARLSLGDPRTARAYPEGPAAQRVLPPATLARAPRSTTDLDAGSFPVRPPEALTFPAGDDVVVCTSPLGFREGLPRVAVTLSFSLPAPVAPSGTGTGPGVLVPPGAGALVRSVPAQGVTTGPVFLVTDEGRRFAVPEEAARKALGYAGVVPRPVPSEFVDLVPAGPALSRASAARTATDDVVLPPAAATTRAAAG